MAKDLVEEPSRLTPHLEACGQLPEVRDQGRRLVVFIDALNEYVDPNGLFREVLGLIHSPEIPAWVKFVTTCRPLPWEQIEAEFQPNYERVMGSVMDGRRRPHHTLGRFTDGELDEAWKKWRKLNDLPDQQLPARHLLKHPILFRCYLDTLARDHTADGQAPITAGEILWRRFQCLNDRGQKHVRSVVSEMWRQGKDGLTSGEVID
jgi:hypothetical protein